jgi:hypothetical protein
MRWQLNYSSIPLSQAASPRRQSDLCPISRAHMQASILDQALKNISQSHCLPLESR